MLILALWSLCFLSVLAVVISGMARQKLVFIYRVNERSVLSSVSGSAAQKALIFLAEKRKDMTFCALNDELSNNPARFQDMRIKDALASVGSSVIGSDGLPTFRYGLIDEARKININTADLAVLTRLFQVTAGIDASEATDLAASCIDWRDSDSDVVIPNAGAEDSYYMIQEFPYEAKDAGFEVLEELLLVKGMREDIFTKVKDYITMYGDGKVNINTA
ncbi:MAG: general secretion pathway protein GspK, partial [Candidatus Omnitrophica bacterium]|nr:general secretion pathway protein GspK [Candidatus Omnitrophota bacterium]